MAKKKSSKPRKQRFKLHHPQSAPKSPVTDLRNQTEFDRLVLASDKPTIIDFWAEWCVPCKATAPAFAAAAERLGDQVNFCKVNTEKNRTVAQSFNIRSIPTMIMMHQGEVIDIKVGATNQAGIEKMANKLIALAAKTKSKEAAAVPAPAAARTAEPSEVDAPEPAAIEHSATPSGFLGKVKSLFAS